MKISNTLLPILLLVAPVLVASYTQALTTPFVPDECDSLMDGVCRQSCTREGARWNASTQSIIIRVTRVVQVRFLNTYVHNK